MRGILITVQRGPIPFLIVFFFLKTSQQNTAVGYMPKLRNIKELLNKLFSRKTKLLSLI